MGHYIPGLIYVLSMALGLVILDGIIDTIAPIASLLITALFAIIFFHVFNRKKIKTLYQACWQHRSAWLATNISVTLMWLGTYYSVKWLNPAAALLLCILSMVAAQYIKALINEKKLTKAVINIIVPTGCIGLFYALHHDEHFARIGITAGIIAGIACVYYNNCSKAFAINSQLTSTDVLAVRFYCIILIAPFFLTQQMLNDISVLEIGKLLLVSLLTFILPLYMYQKSLMQLTIKQHVMVIAATPLAAYLIQGSLRGEWSWLLLSMSLITLLFLVVSQLFFSEKN